MKTLDQIANETNTDRGSARLHDYMRSYDEFFSPVRDKPIIFMEMGILRMDGIKTWCQYFTHPGARIIGIDAFDWKVEPPPDPRLIIRLGDAGNPEFLKSLSGGYDIIIDDAGHFAAQQIASFEFLWPRIAPGGLYCIEDLHTAWDKQLSNAPLTIMQFVHKIEDEMQDHSGAVGAGRPDKKDKWNSIDTITLRKSLVIFRKSLDKS